MDVGVPKNISDYRGLTFVATKRGSYKKLLNLAQNLTYKEMEFEPGYEFALYQYGASYNGEDHIIGMLTVINTDRTIDDEKSGNFAISINELKNSGNLYTQDEIFQMSLDKIEYLVATLLNQGIETYSNIVSFSEYFVEKLSGLINLNQSWPDMYRELWNNKEKIWKVLNRDLCVKTWQCLLDFRFAQTNFHTFLRPTNLKFVDKLSPKQKQNFKLFNIPYIPVLAEAKDAVDGAVECVESFEFEISKFIGFENQLLTYKVYSERALIRSRELLKEVNITTNEVAEIIENVVPPVIPEQFDDKGEVNQNGTNNSKNKTPETSTSKKIISVSTILYLLTKLI